jgi:cell division septum initiation protein DivIVA
MVENGTAGDAGGASDAALVAREFRVSLEHRRDIDDLVADAVAVRQRATVEAAEIVRNAEAMARRIVADARTEAARLTVQAKQALEAATARDDRADAALSEQVSATIGRLESMASDVQMVLDSALAEVAESLAPVAHRQRPEGADAPDAVPDGEPDVMPDGEPEAAPDAESERTAAELRLERWRNRFRQTR